MFNIGDAINPYLLYIKIGVLVIAVCGVIGISWYIRHAFADRAKLQVETGRLRSELVVEKQKYDGLLLQTEQIMAMNQKIIEAVKRVKINSSVYIDRVEAAKLSVPVAGGTVLVPGGMPQAVPANGTLPIFHGYTANRAAALSARDQGASPGNRGR